jgi:hypothetical protein
MAPLLRFLTRRGLRDRRRSSGKHQQEAGQRRCGAPEATNLVSFQCTDEISPRLMRRNIEAAGGNLFSQVASI